MLGRKPIACLMAHPQKHPDRGPDRKTRRAMSAAQAAALEARIHAELEAEDCDDDSPLSVAAFAGNSDGLNSKVLVLNRLYVAVRVISAKRAFCMLARDIAEVIHVENASEGPRYLNFDFESWAEVSLARDRFEGATHDWIRTVRFEIAVPRIIRLLGYDRLPEQTVKLNRRNLFARDRNMCQYCGRHFPTSELSIDHVVPRTAGGGDSWENLVCSCIRCNARKGGRTPDQAGMRLTRKPERPKRNPLIALRLGQEKYTSWKQFLDAAYWSVELK